MENDLIRRSTLIEKFLDNWRVEFSGLAAANFVKKVPAVDAVEVTRCHECQSHTEDPETGKHYCWKPLGCMGCIQVNPDDFCSRGKRKEIEK